MILYTLFYFATFIFVSDTSPQVDDKVLYKRAFDYLNDSVVKRTYPDVEKLAAQCRVCCVKGGDLQFSPELQVTSKYIANNYGFPISDLVRKKYRFSKECLQELRMDTRNCKLANRVVDSLEVFWKGYKMKGKSKIDLSLKDMVSTKKDGYQVFFSDIYKNTLAAEVMKFCSAYDSSMWQGESVV